MGLLNNVIEKIKEMFKRSKTPMLNAGESYEQTQDPREINYLNQPYDVQITNDGQQLTIMSVRFDRQVSHSDGQMTNLMIAKAYHLNNSNDAIMLGSNQERNIAFEIPAGASIDDVILQKVAQYYNYEQQQPDYNQDFTYIGRLSQDQNDLQINKSEAVKQYINKTYLPQIEEQRYEHAQRVAESNRQFEENSKNQAELFRERARQQQIEYENQRNMTKQSRIQNPYLRQIDKRQINGKEHTDYDGINVRTGEILRLRAVDKVGKDANGTYLYTCYLKNTENEHDAEILNPTAMPVGRPVMFTSDKKIEQIIASENPQELNNFLSFLSKVKTNGKSDRLDYIGNFVNGKEDEFLEVQLSDAISNTAVQLQEQYAQRYNEMNQQRENNDGQMQQ